ncbi:interleukin-6 receptor subunit beta [Aplochiton taeniatus]
MELYQAVKAPQPVVTLVNTSIDSVWVTWTPNTLWHSLCKVGHRVSTNKTWPQIAGNISVMDTNNIVYRIRGLHPFTSYCVAVSCSGNSGYWSQWSTEVTGTTLERAPLRPPEVCYHNKKNGTRGKIQLLLMWEALPNPDAGGRILGYEVSYTPVHMQLQASQGVTTNTSELTILLIVEEVELMVSVRAYNGAGHGPASIIRVDPQQDHMSAFSSAFGQLSNFLRVSLSATYLDDREMVNLLNLTSC